VPFVTCQQVVVVYIPLLVSAIITNDH